MALDHRVAKPETASRSALRDFTGFLLRRAYVAVVGAERACLPDDSHVAEVTLLAALAERGAVSQRALSDITHVNRTIIVKLVDTLEARGWVVRERNPADRRSYALRLTPTGEAALADLSRDLDRAEAEITQALDPDQTQRLKKRLQQLLSDDPVLEVRSLADRNGFLIARAHRTFRALAEHQMEPLGIHPRHFGVLVILSQEQPCSQSQVAMRMGVSPAAVLGFVDELEAAGLVQRARNAADRRSYDLALTAQGRRCLGKAMAAAADLQAEIVRRLGPVGDAELRKLLGQIIG